MGFIPLVCSKCGASIRLNDDMETGYFVYCGTKIILEEALTYKAKFKYETNIDNLMHLAMTAYIDHDFQDAIYYFSKVLEHETNNPDALFYKNMAKAWVTKPETISFDSIHNIIELAANNLHEKYSKSSDFNEQEKAISKYIYSTEYFKLVCHVLEEMKRYKRVNIYNEKPLLIYLQQLSRCMHGIADCVNLIDDYAIEHTAGAKYFMVDRMKEVVNLAA